MKKFQQNVQCFKSNTHTHSAEHASHLQDKIELCTSRDLACSFSCLQGFRAQLREQERKTRVIIMRLPNLCHLDIYSVSNILKRRLMDGLEDALVTKEKAGNHTSRILTAKSRRLSNQNAQLPNHRLPSLNAMGRTVFCKISSRMGPSLLCSTTRASATASWKSPSCLMQTLTASFRAPPSRKKAAAYSVTLATF